MMLFLSQIISRLFRHPLSLKFREHYPDIYHFLQNRFSMKHFFGLPFTVMLLLIWLNVMLLSELVETIENSPGMKSFDGKISLWLFSWREPWLSKTLFWFTSLGSFEALAAATVLTSLVLLVKRKFFYLVGFLVSALGSGAAVKITKAYFVRERPLDIGYYAETSFSFPSGHATSAMALEGFIFYLLYRETKDPKLKKMWLLLGISYVLLMGFSRIYLGVHFVSDVLAGFLLGLLWVFFGIILIEYLNMKQKRRSRPLAQPPIQE